MSLPIITVIVFVLSLWAFLSLLKAKDPNAADWELLTALIALVSGAGMVAMIYHYIMFGHI